MTESDFEAAVRLYNEARDGKDCFGKYMSALEHMERVNTELLSEEDRITYHAVLREIEHRLESYIPAA